MASLPAGGAAHPLAIDLLRSICALERGDGQLDAAERDCKRALTLALALHGVGHPATVDARRQLAAIHVDQGRLREAEAAFRTSRAWLAARLGSEHESVAKDDNSLGIIAWERGDIAGARSALDHSIAIRRKRHDERGGELDLAGVLFNKAMVEHDAGRDLDARALLLEALRLRSDRLGATHPLVGDTRRLLGEVEGALGDDARARGELLAAVASTRAGYGPLHPHTRRAELSLAMFDAARGDASALRRLDAFAALSSRDVELRKIRWLAMADAAALRCHGPQRDAALKSLQSLARDIAVAQPEGSVVARQVAGLRIGCA